MKDKIKHYADAIRKANEAAKKVDNIREDGGSCNLDTVMIDFSGWRTKDIQEVAKLSGVRIGDKHTSGWHKGSSFIWTEANGQGFNRTRMVEAADRSLKSDDIPSSVWYQMD